MPPSPPLPSTDAFDPGNPAGEARPSPSSFKGASSEVSDVVALTEAIRLLVAINKRQNAILELFLHQLPLTQPSDTLLESSTDDSAPPHPDAKNTNTQAKPAPETTYIEQWIDRVNLCEQE